MVGLVGFSGYAKETVEAAAYSDRIVAGLQAHHITLLGRVIERDRPLQFIGCNRFGPIEIAVEVAVDAGVMESEIIGSRNCRETRERVGVGTNEDLGSIHKLRKREVAHCSCKGDIAIVADVHLRVVVREKADGKRRLNSPGVPTHLKR